LRRERARGGRRDGQGENTGCERIKKLTHDDLFRILRRVYFLGRPLGDSHRAALLDVEQSLLPVDRSKTQDKSPNLPARATIAADAGRLATSAPGQLVSADADIIMVIY